MINQLLLRKYGGRTGVLLAAMLGAAQLGHRYTMKKLSQLTGLSEKQIGVRFYAIRGMGFVIRSCSVGKSRVGRPACEYWIERPLVQNKTKGAR